MHTLHTQIGMDNMVKIIFSAQTCQYPDIDGTRLSVTYFPSCCEYTFNSTNCVANYTCLNESATCSCTRNDTTGSIRCSSDLVTQLIMNCPSDVSTTTDITPLTG